ncbi:LytR C-terminal domain-containing protein [Propionivibrio limicola]|uniref:LytR C-terminal domain-containing protein n=1 Tax=Propionivibrio limicola TaxID=167645 RepID=UPI0012909D76|nr:LytR C-terminal domain-containing protein [Propionivibrio limicola]
MKLRLIVFALIAALGSGCASTDKMHSALQVKPLSEVRHGGANALAYYQLGRYYQGQQRFVQAEEAYLKAISMDARHVDAFNALGSLYGERGELDKAIHSFQRAIAIAPGAAYLRNNLGFAYFLQGRYDEAYASVRQALGLDPRLERGWSNLERIASAQSDVLLAKVVKWRRLDALPLDMAARPEMTFEEPAPVQIPTVVASAPQVPQQESPPNVIDLGGAQLLQPKQEVVIPPPIAGNSGNGSTQMQQAEPPASNGKFVLVSASQEVALNVEQPVKIAVAAPEKSAEPAPAERVMPPATPPAMPASPAAEKKDSTPEVNIASVRFEVSNGNGVTGFARKFGAFLRGNDIPVKRITNYDSFSIRETVVEYQPGFEPAARLLMSVSNLEARLMPAKKPRPGSDVRLVLGKDAV